VYTQYRFSSKSALKQMNFYVVAVVVVAVVVAAVVVVVVVVVFFRVQFALPARVR